VIVAASTTGKRYSIKGRFYGIKFRLLKDFIVIHLSNVIHNTKILNNYIKHRLG